MPHSLNDLVAEDSLRGAIPTSDGPSPLRGVLSTAMVGLVIGTVFVSAFLTAFHVPRPHDFPAGIVGAPAQVAVISSGLTSPAGGSVKLVPYGAACGEIEDRPGYRYFDVDVDAGGKTGDLQYAGANRPAVQATPEDIIQGVAPGSGATLRSVNVEPASAGGRCTVRRAGARVIGRASEPHHAWLAESGVLPVTYGGGAAVRIRAAADFAGAQKHGTRTEGSAAAATPDVLGELAALIADGQLEIPIALHLSACRGPQGVRGTGTPAYQGKDRAQALTEFICAHTERRGVMFTDSELEYLSTQRLGRLATAQPDGTLQVSPVGFRYNDRTGAIDVAGRGMARSRKFRNVAANGQVAFVIDDVASVQPWRPRCVEIRGEGQAIAEPTDSAWAADLARTGFDGAIIRIHPRRIISFGIDEASSDVYEFKVNKRTVG